MRLLILYWNELSIPNDLSEGELGANGPWAARALSLYESLRAAWRIQPHARLSVKKGQFHGLIMARPLLSWLELWLGREKVRFIKLNSIQPQLDLEEPIHDLACEVDFNGQVGEGLTRAYLAESWVWSLGHEDTGSHESTILATKLILDNAGDTVSEDVVVMNIAEQSHVQHWENAIAGWDEQESPSSVVGCVSGNQVLMYPLDHGYSHIHIKVPGQRISSIKYRVDSCTPLCGTTAALDSLMIPWIRQHSDILMESWRRCQIGLHPLRIGGEQ